MLAKRMLVDHDNLSACPILETEGAVPHQHLIDPATIDCLGRYVVLNKAHCGPPINTVHGLARLCLSNLAKIMLVDHDKPKSPLTVTLKQKEVCRVLVPLILRRSIA